MSEYHIVGIEEITDKNGMKLLSPIIQNVNKKKPLERLLNDGLQIVSGAALAACMWKLKFHPIVSLGFCAMSIEGGVDFYKHMQKYFRKSSPHLKERIKSTILLATGTFTYFANVVLFSRAVKQNNRLWIPYLGMAAVGYFLTVWSNNMLERTILNVTPVFKCCQLLFRPALIAIAAFYLLSHQQKHDEEWVWWLTLVAFATDADYMANNGHYRDANHREPRWLLLKGLELLVGGCILCVNGAVLLVYAINNQFCYKQLFFALGFITAICYGSGDVTDALECFQRYSLMEERVYDCVCGMIIGPIIFFSACICSMLAKRLIMLPGFLFISGMGLAMLGHSVFILYDLVPRYVFMRYCRRVLGPVAIAYSTFVTAYIGYRIGWRFSMVLMPLIPFGIHATYRGWRE